jgi:hypothetical protein
MIFCIPWWIFSISQLIGSIALLCSPIIENIMAILVMGPMMKAIFGSMMPFIEQMAEMGEQAAAIGATG